MSARLSAAFDARFLDAWFLAAITLGAIVIFRIIEPSWLNSQTLPSIITQNGPLAIVAMAMTFSIIARHIDLSPGSMLALASVVTGMVYRDEGSLLLGLLVALGVCLGVGLFNGLLVARLGLSAIMVTLATYIWARGLALGLTDGHPIVVDTRLTSIMNHSVGGFTIVAPLVLVVYLIGGYVLSRTRFGRYTHAMGGDPVAARRAGVRVALNTTLVFALMGLATWLASTIVVGQLESAQPYAAPTLELDAIIAVIIGGSRLAGGEGSVGRTLLGVSFISILNSGLLNLGLSNADYQLYKGSALLAILAAQILLRRRVASDLRRRLEEERLVAEARGYA